MIPVFNNTACIVNFWCFHIFSTCLSTFIFWFTIDITVVQFTQSWSCFQTHAIWLSVSEHEIHALISYDYFCTFTHSNEIWFCVCAIQNTSQQRKFLWIQTAWVFFRAQLLNHVFSMRLTGNDKHFFSTVVAMTQKFHIYAYWVFIQIETNAMLLPYRTLRLELFILSNWFINKFMRDIETYISAFKLRFCVFGTEIQTKSHT